MAVTAGQLAAGIHHRYLGLFAIGLWQAQGLPLGIAATLILNGSISLTGLQIPTAKEIYEPVLQELELQGISFTEKKM